jgi:hypothetical protein
MSARPALDAPLEDHIDWILERLIFARPAPPKDARTAALFPLSSFRDVDAMALDPRPEMEGRIFLHPYKDEVTPEVIWPVDVSIAHCRAEGIVEINHYRSATTREARGRAALFSPYMLAGRVCHIAPDDTFTTATCFLARIGGRWVDAEQRRVLWTRAGIPDRQGTTAADDMVGRAALSIALTRRYEWTVSLGIEDSPTVAFVTDPAGARAAFRLRDVPEGRQRRAALRNWVAEHWRRKAAPSAVDRAFVREHLRGATRFRWNGLDCEITPSAFDLERNSQPRAREAVR